MKMTDAKIILSATNEELERIQNDTLVLTQEKIQNDKIMTVKNVSQQG